MPRLIPQYAFVAGEVGPEFYGRSDLVKYSLGVKLAHNFFIGNRGGLYSRQGSRFVGPLKTDEKDIYIHRFRATTGDYLLVFYDLSMRVVRNGGYILEAAETISGMSAADPAVLTVTGHSLATGDWAYVTGVGAPAEVNGRYFQIGVTATNTVQLLLPDGTNFDSSALDAYTSGGTISKVYTLTTTYVAAHLKALHIEQEFNDLTITHTSYPPRKLTYVSDTNWTIADITYGASLAAPTGLALTTSSAGTAGMAFAVTAVIDGKESLPSAYELHELSVDYTTTAGSMLVEWTAVADADWYHIYRSLILPKGADISLAQEVGYLGRAFAPQFTDANIIADYTKTPPINFNPFANETVTAIAVTAPGTGYAKADTISLSGGGTGFVGYPIINDAGEVIDIVIVNGGAGYSSPVVSFTTSTGSGATATASVGPATGNYPSVYRKFQQRGVYAGSINYPVTLWGSKPGDTDNFDISIEVNAGDSYSYRLDAQEVRPLRHLVALRSGLLLFSDASITQLMAGEGLSVSPLSALAEPQAYKGASDTHPITIGLDVIFVQNIGSVLNAMMYTEYTNTFALQNLSVLAHHLVSERHEVTRMEFVEEPDKLLYCLREDGALLTLTYDRSEEVFGWAQHWTRGLYKDCCAIEEDGEWVLYTVVERYINGAWAKTIERTLPRTFDLVEDYWGVDCGLELTQETPDATLTAAAITGTNITLTASASVFAAGDVGKVIRMGGGKATIATYASGTSVGATFSRDITNTLPESDGTLPLVAASGDWSMTDPVTTISNLWHLEGETVSVLADGVEYTGKVVTNGAITIPVAASKIIVGLPYTCRTTTLPVVAQDDIMESRRTDILGCGVRLDKTRGLTIGADFDNQYSMKDTDSVGWDAEVALRSDSSYAAVDSAWDEEGTVSFEQVNPLPATILALQFDVDAGDT